VICNLLAVRPALYPTRAFVGIKAGLLTTLLWQMPKARFGEVEETANYLCGTTACN